MPEHQKEFERLPKWVQQHINSLKKERGRLEKKIKTLEEMLPWVKASAGMEWFCVGCHDSAGDTFFNLDKCGAYARFTLYKGDYIFIGRAKYGS